MEREVGLGTFRPCLPTNKFRSPPELEANSFDFFFFFLSLPLLGIAPWAPLYNARTGPDWPVREGPFVCETRDPVLLVSGRVRHAPRAKTRQNSCKKERRK